MTRLLGAGRATFKAFEIPNYRRYYRRPGDLAERHLDADGGASVARADAHRLGHHARADRGACRRCPILLLGPYGGVIADRVDKRRLMVWLQSAMGLQALVLGLLTVTGAVRVWEIGALAMLLGLNSAFENPARQSFMLEMVGPEHLRNAVSLNSVLVNVARTIGPAIAGLLDSDGRRGRVLPGQRRELRGGDCLAADTRPRRAAARVLPPSAGRDSCARA